MHSKKAFLFLAVPFFTLTIFAGYGQAPKLSFKHLGYEQGLSSTSIESIVQDFQGYMWFGSRDGLNRYDGHEMRIFRHDPADSAGISDNYITCLFMDHAHALWVGTMNGLNRFDPYSDRFTRFEHADRDVNSVAGNMVNAICEDAEHRLWVSTSDGLSLYDRSTHRFTSYRISTSFPEYSGKGRINGLCNDTAGRLWVATNAGLFLFDANAHLFRKPDYPNLPADILVKFVKQDGGMLWLGTQSNGLFQLDPATGAVTAFRHDERNDSSLSSNMIESLLFDKTGRLWIGTINGGLNLLNRATQHFYHYKEERELQQGLSKRTVSALFEDRDGNLWVGTHRGGVNMSSPYGEKFMVHRKNPNGQGLSYDDVNAFTEAPNGDLWIGTDGGGLNYFNRHKNTFTYYRFNAFDPHSLGADEVLNIYRDSHDELWVATWGGGLNRMDRSGKGFIRYKNDPGDSNSISSNYVQSMLEDKNGNFWVATYYGGLNRFDRATGKFHRIVFDPSGHTQLTGNNIVSMTEEPGGKLWFGTDDGGLNCYNPVTQHFTHYFNGTPKKGDLRVLFVDQANHLWVGQEGLYRYDSSKDTFLPYPAQSELANEFIKGITEDDQHHFWISTSRGLIEFDPLDSTVKKYNTSDGLQGLQFEANSCLRTRNGEMFFGGLNGFNSFYPENIRVNRHIPPVYITELQIFNEKILPATHHSILSHDISFTDSIVLSHNQSSIAFNFAALNYTNSENNQYAYKLEGFDKDWHYANNENRANYTNLDPGEYVFHVKASNNDGIWNDTGSSIRIFIRPPFWKTSWFLFLLSLLMVCTVYTVYRRKRMTQIKKMEQKKQQELVQLQLQFFTNMSHELRTPLMLILGPAERLLKDDATPETRSWHQSIYRNASRLLNLINELMDYRKLQGGALKLQVVPGNLNSFLKEISEEFHDWARVKSIRFDLHLHTVLPDIWYDRQVLEKIVLNLLSNAFKYTTTGGTIELDVFESMDKFQPAFANDMVLLNEHRAGKYVYIRIRDNGVGISEDSIRLIFERYYRVSEYHLGSGIGLAFVKSLTQLHKGDIYVHSERHKGTEIIIGLPAEEDSYLPEEKWVNQETGTRAKLESLHTRYEEEFPASERPARAVPPKKMHARRILITEDNEELRAFLRDCLQEYYDISEAGDGAEGLEKAKEETPDLIISDVMMPEMGGIEFCKRVKQDIEISHIPFVMLTAKDANPDKIEGAEAGADLYFSKPVNIQLLLLTIRNIFDQREKLREHYIKSYQVDARDLLHTTRDKEFMDHLLETIDAELMNPDLDIEYLCRKMNMSRSKLYEKIKALTGQSTGDFIRTIRLKKAVDIMLHEDVSLMEIAIRIGIQTQSYFTKAFRKQYGKTPMQFMQELIKK